MAATPPERAGVEGHGPHLPPPLFAAVGTLQEAQTGASSALCTWLQEDASGTVALYGHRTTGWELEGTLDKHRAQQSLSFSESQTPLRW